MVSGYLWGFKCLLLVVITTVASDISTEWTPLIRIRNGRAANGLEVLQSPYNDVTKCPTTNQPYTFSSDYCTGTYVGSWLDANLAEQVFLTLRNNQGEIMYYILFQKDPAVSAPTDLTTWFETASVRSSSFSLLGSKMNVTVQRHILGFAVFNEQFKEDDKDLLRDLWLSLHLALQQIDGVWYNAITNGLDGTQTYVFKDQDMCFADHLSTYNETDIECEHARSLSECYLCCVRDNDDQFAAVKLSQSMDFSEFQICRCFDRVDQDAEKNAVDAVTNVDGSCKSYLDCRDHSLGFCIFFQRLEQKYQVVRDILQGNNGYFVSRNSLKLETSKISIEATTDITRRPLYASSVWFNMTSTPSTSCTWTVTYFPFDKCNVPNPYLVYSRNVTVPRYIGTTMEVEFGDVIRIGCVNLTSSCYNKHSIIQARLKGVTRDMVHAPILELMATQADIPPPDGYPPGTKNFTFSSAIFETTTSEPELSTDETTTTPSNIATSSSPGTTISMTTDNSGSSQTTTTAKTTTNNVNVISGGGSAENIPASIATSNPTSYSNTVNLQHSETPATAASTYVTTPSTVTENSPQNNTIGYNIQENSTESSPETNQTWSPPNNTESYNSPETSSESSPGTNQSWIPLSDDFIQIQLAADTFVCKNVTIVVHNVTTIGELEEELKQITKNLTVQRSSLSSTIRRKSSAKDNRTSATSIGMIGIIILSCEIGFFIFLDFTYLVDAAVKLKNNLRLKE